jgi:hypothetical protein
VPLSTVLIVLLVALCISGVVIWARLVGSNARVVDLPGGEPQQIFRGGVMSRHVVTSGTLVRLDVYEWGIRIHGNLVSRWIVPTWEARFDELAIAELVALPASRIAVCFRLRDSDPRVIAFLSDQNTRILRALEAHDVPVNRAVTKIRRVDELYQ